MLSFMNLSGKKKRRRGSKRGRAPSAAPTATATTRASVRRSRNSSDSFLSPEAILRIGIDESEKKGVGFGRNPSYVEQSLVVPEWPSQRKEEDKSPALQLEFHHEPWLSQFPRELLKSRNGSGSMSSMDDLMMSARPRRAQGSKSSIDVPKMSNSPGSSRRAIPIPSPIEIPVLNPKAIASQPQDRDGPLSLAPPSSYLLPTDDDGDMDRMSTISGVSAARDVFAKSFSFVSTPATQYELELPPDHSLEADRSGDARQSTSRAKDRLKHRTVRQDSATLPRDFNWTERPKSGHEDPRRSSSAAASRKSSTHSLWKRNAVAEQELGDALKEVLKAERGGKGTSQADFQLGPSSTRSRSQHAAPSAPPLTPGAQKLDKADQAALHRVSRVVEVPTPPSSPEKPRRQQGMNKTSSTSLAHSSRTHAASVSSSRPPTSRTAISSVSPPPSSISKSSKSTTPSAVQTAATSASSGSSFSLKYTTTVPSTARTKITLDEGTIDDEVQRMDFVSFLDDFQISSPANSLSHNDLLNDAISRQAQSSASSPAKPHKPTSHSPKSNDVANTSSSFLRLRSQRKPSHKPRSLTSQASNFTFGTATSSNDRSQKHSNDIVLDISSDRSVAKAKSKERIVKASTSIPSIKDYRTLPPSSQFLRPEAEGYDIERRRPSLPQLHTSHPDTPDEEESSSARSPDLLDMLIPNGNIVSPISSTRRKLGRKRSGSTPNPIRLMRSDTGRYRDGGMSFTLIRDMDVYEGDEIAPTPTTTLDHGQTFPETPRAFSPILTADFPVEDVYPSVSNVLSQVREALVESESELDGRAFRRPPSPTSPVDDELVGRKLTTITTTADSVEDASYGETTEEKLERISRRYSRPKSYPSTLNSSPPISPLDLPPLPVLSPTTSSPSLRNEPLTPAPNGIQRPLPIVETIITPPHKRVGTRPRLPFGPRKPNQPSLTQPPSASLLGSLYGSAPASLNGSPDAAHLVYNSGTSSPAANTPSFKTTPIRWRGYTYDVAQWVLTSSELQSIVSRAIRQSSNPSTVRILTLDVLDRELPEEMENLEARKAEIEMNYKVQVRKRRMLLHYLSSLSQTQLASKGDICASAGRLAEEISDVTNHCDRLAEELLDISDQLGQIKKLKEVHSASAFNMALRKLYAKYTSQVEENQALKREVADLTAESDMAWKQAEDLVLDLDNLSTTYGDASDVYGVSDSATVKTSSRRSSRMSLGRKSLSMRRASRLSIRNSSVSSLRVNLSSGVRSTFSSDTIPPVPPLPEYRNSAFSETLSNRASYERKRTVSGIPPSRAEDIQRMEREIFDLLDPESHSKAGEAPRTPVRRQSIIGTIYREDDFQTMRQSRHLRNCSLPSLPLNTVSTTYYN